MISKEIVFCGKEVTLACDANCRKAWGANSRPRVYFYNEKEVPETLYWERREDGIHQREEYRDADLDDYYYLPDQELEEAPCDPGTYEGGDAKPRTARTRLNRWCARECERSVMVEKGKTVRLPDFSKRQYNKHARQEESEKRPLPEQGSLEADKDSLGSLEVAATPDEVI